MAECLPALESSPASSSSSRPWCTLPAARVPRVRPEETTHGMNRNQMWKTEVHRTPMSVQKTDSDVGYVCRMCSCSKWWCYIWNDQELDSISPVKTPNKCHRPGCLRTPFDLEMWKQKKKNTGHWPSSGTCFQPIGRTWHVETPWHFPSLSWSQPHRSNNHINTVLPIVSNLPLWCGSPLDIKRFKHRATFQVFQSHVQIIFQAITLNLSWHWISSNNREWNLTTTFNVLTILDIHDNYVMYVCVCM